MYSFVKIIPIVIILKQKKYKFNLPTIIYEIKINTAILLKH